MTPQDWNPDRYARSARFVSELGRPLIDLLAPRAGERVLDLGCGDGELSIELERLGCKVLGVDSSREMVEAARARGVDARPGDAQALGFEEEFDAVFSNAALHWMIEPVGVVSGVWRALKAGGRFVGEFGGHGNVSAIVAALESALSSRGLQAPRPWYFPGPEEYGRLLESQGFEVNALTHFPRPTPLPADLAAWLETFARPYLSCVSAEDRSALVSDVLDAARPALRDAAGNWHADYVRLRFAATKADAGTRPEAGRTRGTDDSPDACTW